MIGIEAIGSYIPKNEIDNFKQAEKFGETEDFINKKIGAQKLPRLSESEDASDIAVKAVESLIENCNLDLNEVQAIVVVTQNGDFGGLPHTSALVQAKLKLDTHVSAFDVSLGCSGYVYGLSILKAHMEELGFSKGLLITVDPYSKILNEEDRVTSLLFGDAATATLLSTNVKFKIGKPVLQTDGSGYEALLKKEFLIMNGRKVFNFAAMNVPKQISDYLQNIDLTVENVDKFLLHQGSAAIVEVIARKVGGDKAKFPLDITETGNTVSSSIPLLLEKELNDLTNNKIVISGFGVGLSWATNLLERV